jgi:acetyltransferase-like isoleucine patch superfamily enzyme
MAWTVVGPTGPMRVTPQSRVGGGPTMASLACSERMRFHRCDFVPSEGSSDPAAGRCTRCRRAAPAGARRASARALLRRALAALPRLEFLYRRLCRPDGFEWAQYLRRHRGLHRMGEDCSIQPGAQITDPRLVRMGRNVRLSACTIFGHDGSVNMLNRAFGLKLDAVGPVILGDDVFVGHGALIMPGVRIGSRVVIAAGAVVTGDVPDDSVYGGVPAKRICSIGELVERKRRVSESYPWRDLLAAREGDFDPQMEGRLEAMREAHFFGAS